MIKVNFSCTTVSTIGNTLIYRAIPPGTLLRVCPVTDKGKILVLCFLSSGVVPVMTEDDDTSTSMPSSHTNLIVSCDDGTFCLLQCGVAHSPPAKPLVDR